MTVFNLTVLQVRCECEKHSAIDMCQDYDYYNQGELRDREQNISTYETWFYKFIFGKRAYFLLIFKPSAELEKIQYHNTSCKNFFPIQ